MGWALALAAGMVTAFNPCGVALLPAFLSLLLVQQGRSSGRWTTGLQAGVTMTMGFVLIFGLAGLVVASLGRVLFVVAPLTSMVVAILLLVMAWQLWHGREMWAGVSRWVTSTLRWLKPAQGGFFVYGVSYGLVSLTCSFPVFLSIAATGFQQSWGIGLVRYGVYAVGMGLMVTVLAILTVLTRRVADATIHLLMPVIPKVSAGVMALASLYLLWYWLGGPGTHTRLL